MSFQPLVTCIIPVYNAEKYIRQGLNSLLRQTYENVEIIVVDDRSTDRSWSICEEYSNNHENIRVIQNEKNTGGPLRGRELGIKESNGDWITFMDGDDYVTPTYIENLVKATDNGKYDIAVTGHSILHMDMHIENFLWKNYAQSTAERLKVFYEHFLKHDFWTDPTDTIGQNLIRASICKKADLSKYSNNVYAEDTLMALEFLSHSKNGVNFVDTHDFVWRQIEGSGSNGGFSDHANKDEFYKACFAVFHSDAVYEVLSQKAPLISIIIPVYNVEKYLKECLKSVIGQTYSKLEIVIVNDGTTDRSQQIIDEFKKTDNRIVSIEQTNQGLNMARANGVKASRGDYIAFVDSDDVVHRDYIRLMYENIIANDVDISVSGLSVFDDNRDVLVDKEIIPNFKEQILRNKREALLYYFGEIQSVSNVHQMTAWGKLYKADIVKSTDWAFSNYRRHEDNLESLQWYNTAVKGISVMSTQLYYYRNNPNSITKSVQPNINPKGLSLNYFEFIAELYVKMKSYLNDDFFDLAILNNLANTNRSQVYNFYVDKKIDETNMKSATDNWDLIIESFNYQISLRDKVIDNQQNQLNDVRNSPSWKITKPFRTFKKIVKKVISR
jgi:glycosyltransferase involved in cell wall biosynthesis